MADAGQNGNGRAISVYRSIALVTTTALITGTGAWMLLARDTMTRVEVRQLLTDMGADKYQVEREYLRSTVKDTSDDVRSIKHDLGDVQTQVKVINERLEQWLHAAGISPAPVPAPMPRGR